MIEGRKSFLAHHHERETIKGRKTKKKTKTKTKTKTSF